MVTTFSTEKKALKFRKYYLKKEFRDFYVTIVYEEGKIGNKLQL